MKEKNILLYLNLGFYLWHYLSGQVMFSLVVDDDVGGDVFFDNLNNIVP